MNKIILMGRLTKDPTVEYTQSGKVYAKISVAVDRPYAAAGKEKKVDFFDCVAFGKTAEVLGNHFTKGKPILLDGSVQFNEYTNREGAKCRSTSVVIAHIEFVAGSKKTAEKPAGAAASEGFGTFGADVTGEEMVIDF